jgi:hypothetical protein
LSLPDGHHDYLVFLVNVKGWLGSSLNDAAKHILVRELDRMMQSGYHEKEIPE